ncbi:MAG TPA: hypothetical protein VNM66_09720 [Thermodesulfobacteriota bacterium]|nr:hypothetical protein [Thermodesulfobacteriota bacterium]
MPAPRPALPSGTCPRCGQAFSAERPRGLGLTGGAICEPCQHLELEELLAQLEHVPPGPAAPSRAPSQVAADPWRL